MRTAKDSGAWTKLRIVSRPDESTVSRAAATSVPARRNVPPASGVSLYAAAQRRSRCRTTSSRLREFAIAARWLRRRARPDPTRSPTTRRTDCAAMPSPATTAIATGARPDHGRHDQRGHDDLRERDRQTAAVDAVEAPPQQQQQQPAVGERGERRAEREPAKSHARARASGSATRLTAIEAALTHRPARGSAASA